jgi:hypothetical protein
MYLQMKGSSEIHLDREPISRSDEPLTVQILAILVFLPNIAYTEKIAEPIVYRIRTVWIFCKLAEEGKHFI